MNIYFLIKKYQVFCNGDSRNNNITLLGSGTYGCVITRPISNKNYIIKEYIPYRDIDDSDIGKIYKKEDEDDDDETE